LIILQISQDGPKIAVLPHSPTEFLPFRHRDIHRDRTMSASRSASSPPHLAGLGDVGIRQCGAYPRPRDLELGFAVLKIGAAAVVAAKGRLAVEREAPPP
jgi:hypothetical protein